MGGYQVEPLISRLNITTIKHQLHGGSGHCHSLTEGIENVPPFPPQSYGNWKCSIISTCSCACTFNSLRRFTTISSSSKETFISILHPSQVAGINIDMLCSIYIWHFWLVFYFSNCSRNTKPRADSQQTLQFVFLCWRHPLVYRQVSFLVIISKREKYFKLTEKKFEDIVLDVTVVSISLLLLQPSQWESCVMLL